MDSIIQGLLAGVILFLIFRLWQERQTINRLKSVIRMDGAPKAPCVLCEREDNHGFCSHDCRCECHKERILYVSRSFDEAMKL